MTEPSDQPRSPAVGEGPRRRRQHEDGERCAGDVEGAPGVRVPRLRHGTGADEHERSDRHVDEERPPPARSVDEPPADERSDRPEYAAQPGPSPDGARAVVAPEARLEDRQTARREQRCADTLEDPSRDEHFDARRGAAQQRGEGEPHGADHEDPAAAVPVAERTAEQDERGQRQQVPGEHPLQRTDPGVEVVADVRQGDVDDGRIQRRHPTRRDGRDHSEATPAGTQHQLLVRGRHVEHRHGAYGRPSAPTAARVSVRGPDRVSQSDGDNPGPLGHERLRLGVRIGLGRFDETPASGLAMSGDGQIHEVDLRRDPICPATTADPRALPTHSFDDVPRVRRWEPFDRLSLSGSDRGSESPHRQEISSGPPSENAPVGARSGHGHAQ